MRRLQMKFVEIKNQRDYKSPDFERRLSSHHTLNTDPTPPESTASQSQVLFKVSHFLFLFLVFLLEALLYYYPVSLDFYLFPTSI